MASLDLGALSYTLKLNREGFSEGINQTKSDMKGLSDGVKTADEANKVYQSNMKSFEASLKETGVSFENLDQKLKKWMASSKEDTSEIQINNQVIETNKAKMAELASQIGKVETVLRETKTIFGESSSEYKKVESSVIELELSYGKLEEENKKLIASNREMEASANPSFFKKLNSSISSVGEATEKLGVKGVSVGGILKNAFGSIKSVVMNTAVPIMAGMGLQSLIDKSKAGQQAVGQMNAVLASTHGVAGMTKDALLNLAQSQSQVTTYSKGANIATENLLLTFTNIGKDVFPSALKAVNDMSTALGQDTKSSAIQLGKALNDPISGITALSRVGVNFTEKQKQQIKTMVETGHAAEAQKAIVAELSKEFGGSAVAAGKTFDGQLTIIKNQLFGIGAGITSQLMPPVTSLLTMLNSHMPQIQSTVNSVISGVTTSFRTLGPILLGIGQDVGKIATEVFPQMNSSGNNLGKTILSLTKGALTDLKGVFDWLAQHGNVTRAAIIGIGTAFAALKAASSISNIFKAFTDGAAGIKTATGLVSNFGKAFNTLKTGGSVVKAISQAFGLANPTILIVVASITAVAMIATLVITHWKPIKAFFTGLWTGVKQKFTAFWNWLKPFIARWGPIILTAIAPLIGIPLLIVQHWGGIKAFITNLWNSIKSTTTSAWNSIVNSIKSFVIGVKNTITSTWNGLKNIVSTIWNGIVSVVTAIVTPFVNGITNIWKNMSTGVSAILTGFQNTIKGIWEAIKNTILGPVLLILDLVTGNFTKLSQDAQMIFNNLMNAFSNIWNGIHQIFAGVVQAIVGFVIGAFQNASNNIQVIWNAVSSFLSSLWSGIVSTAQSIWNGLLNFLSNLWTSITSTATNAWNSLSSAVTSIITAIVSTAQNIWNGLLNWFAALPGRLYNLGVSIFNSMKSGVSSALSTLGSVVQNGFNSAINFITSLPSKAIKWGEDFIDGLINGIKGKIGDVGNAVSDVANKIRSFLHFSVPDEGPLTDYETWMPDFMEGLAKGIDGNLNVLDNSLIKVSDTLAKAVMPERNTRSSIFDSLAKGADTYESAIQKLSHANDMLSISTGNSETDLRNMLGEMTNISTMAAIANQQYQKLGNSLGWTNEKTQSALKSYEDYQKAYAETAQKVADAEQKIKDNELDEFYNKVDAKVKSLTSDTDDLVQKMLNQQDALDELQLKGMELDLQYQEIIKTYGKFSDKAKEAAKSVDENNQAIQDLNKNLQETQEKMEETSVSSLNSLFDKLKSALKDYYDDSEKQDEKYWQAKKDSNDKWKEDTLDSLESVYNAKKAEIEKEKTLLDRNNDDEDSNDKIKEDQRILNMNYSAKAKTDAQKDMNNEIKEMNRRHQKESLEDQQTALESQYSADKNNVEKVSKANEEYYSSQIEKIKSFYEDKEKAANLDAEAQQMITQNNQEEIVKLLKSYGEDYEMTGASLGERFVKGLKDKMFSIEQIFEGVTLQANDIVNKITSTPSVSAAYAGGYYGGNGNSSNTTNKTTVNNSYGSLLHADTIVLNNGKDVQQTAEELEFLREKAARSRGVK